MFSALVPLPHMGRGDHRGDGRRKDRHAGLKSTWPHMSGLGRDASAHTRRRSQRQGAHLYRRHQLAERAPVTPTDAGWIAYDAARGLHGIPLLTANTMNAVAHLSPGTAAKNTALAEALTSRGVDKDSIAAAIGDLLARRVAAQNAGMTLAPVFAGVGLGALDR